MRVRGRVDAYDPVNGFGFIKVGGVTYFAHNSEVRLKFPMSLADLGVPPPPFLLPDWEVEFEAVKQADGRWKATNVVPQNPKGFTINPVGRRLMVQQGVVAVEVSGDNSIHILGEKTDPVVNSDHFRIYYLGLGTIRSFSVKVPNPNAEKAFVLVTPSPEKAPRRTVPDGLYTNVRNGSFILTVRADGHVLVQKVGAHSYGFEENWLVLSRRFEHKYSFSQEPDKEELLRQTPDVGKADANWGFIPGILQGIELLRKAATPTT